MTTLVGSLTIADLGPDVMAILKEHEEGGGGYVCCAEKHGRHSALRCTVTWVLRCRSSNAWVSLHIACPNQVPCTIPLSRKRLLCGTGLSEQEKNHPHGPHGSCRDLLWLGASAQRLADALTRPLAPDEGGHR
jgi:hypothetical protein